MSIVGLDTKNRLFASLFTLATVCSFAQEPTFRPYFFEVASVKRVAAPDLGGSRMKGGPGTDDPGRLICSHVTLEQLIARAYDLRPYQIVGLPRSNAGRYDIVANIPPGSTKTEFSYMLRNLVAERFGLTFHWEVKDISVLLLTVAKGGAKVKESVIPQRAEAATSGDRGAVAPPTIKMSRAHSGDMELPPGVRGLVIFPAKGGVRVSARLQTMDALVRTLEGFRSYVDRPVLDATGLTGVYDFNLDVAIGGPIMQNGVTGGPGLGAAQSYPLDLASDPGFSSLFVALERQLGLRLEGKKERLRALVIDNVNNEPTEN